MNLNLRTAPCDPVRLEAFLNGELNDAVEREFTLHLNTCENCRVALEQQAAEPQAWSEAELLLKPSQFDAPADDADDAENERSEGRLPLQIQNVIDALRPTDDPEMLGRLGGYEVSGVVGSGGMGVVLKAVDKSLDRIVAVKVLSPHLATSAAARKRFAREAKAAAAVLHPNVIAIHGVSNDESLPYLVMPYICGISLQKRLEEEGSLPLNEILRIGSQIAAGLAAAHAQGLVHRDIKPANILLESGVERVAITDFGLARAVDDATITHSGVIAGTPQYMSPEQARGEAVDGRSDLFSLGCVLYEMATGVSPFRANSTMATLRRLIDDAPQALASRNPQLPPWFNAIVERLLEKDPAKRFRSAKEVSELLENCLAHVQQPANVPLPAGMTVPDAVKGRSVGRGWKVAAGLIATIGIVLGGAVVSATPPDISGNWSGEEWGSVELKPTGRGEYEGTYTETVGKSPGTFSISWNRIERRFKGDWKEGEDRFGRISIRLNGAEIRGSFTTSKDSKVNPATPELGDLTWVRAPSVVETPQNDKKTWMPKNGQGLAGAQPLPHRERKHRVAFELGATSLLEGDQIYIDEVMGTADTIKVGESYEVRGRYRLGSRPKASLQLSITDVETQIKSRPGIGVRDQFSYWKLISKGEGTFHFVFHMAYKGKPHISFYPDNGEGYFGHVYFGTGDSVLKQGWWETAKAPATTATPAISAGDWGDPGTDGLRIRMRMEAGQTLTPQTNRAILDVWNTGSKPVKLAEQREIPGRKPVADDWVIGLRIASTDQYWAPGTGIFERQDDAGGYWYSLKDFTGKIREIPAGGKTRFKVQLRELDESRSRRLLVQTGDLKVWPVLQTVTRNTRPEDAPKEKLWQGQVRGGPFTIRIDGNQSVAVTSNQTGKIFPGGNDRKSKLTPEWGDAGTDGVRIRLVLDPFQRDDGPYPGYPGSLIYRLQHADANQVAVQLRRLLGVSAKDAATPAVPPIERILVRGKKMEITLPASQTRILKTRDPIVSITGYQPRLIAFDRNYKSDPGDADQFDELLIQQKLDKKVSFGLDNFPLEDFVETVTHEANLGFVFDAAGLQQVSVNLETPVTSFGDKITVRQALKQILEPLKLGYVIKNQTLHITSVQRLPKAPNEVRLHGIAPGRTQFKLVESSGVEHLVEVIVTKPVAFVGPDDSKVRVVPNSWTRTIYVFAVPETLQIASELLPRLDVRPGEKVPDLRPELVDRLHRSRFTSDALLTDANNHAVLEIWNSSDKPIRIAERTKRGDSKVLNYGGVQPRIIEEPRKEGDSKVPANDRVLGAEFDFNDGTTITRQHIRAGDEDWLIGLEIDATDGSGITRRYVRADNQEGHWTYFEEPSVAWPSDEYSGESTVVPPGKSARFKIQLRRLVDHEGNNLLNLKGPIQLRPVLRTNQPSRTLSSTAMAEEPGKVRVWRGEATGKPVPVEIAAAHDGRTEFKDEPELPKKSGAKLDQAEPLDLSGQYQSTAAQFVNDKNYPWRIVPRGAKLFGKVPMNIDGRIALWGAKNADQKQVFAEKVTPIPVNREVDTLYVYHASFFASREGAPVYLLMLNYIDGTTSKITIRYGDHLRDWYQFPTEQVSELKDPNSKFVWTADHPERPNFKLRFLSLRSRTNVPMLKSNRSALPRQKGIPPAASWR